MAENILAVDDGMAHAAMDHPNTVAVIYDFAAAFPSVEHAVLFAYFLSLGWPAWLRTMIFILYANNFCSINMCSGVFSGFAITRGIRQGCPLSPLLFAAASELLLRRLRRLVPRTINRSWADDLAMVLNDGVACLPTLSNIFEDFSLISGLFINIGKTCIIPFSPTDLFNLRAELARLVPDWSAVTLAFAATYLGVFVGPGTVSYTHLTLPTNLRV